MIFRNVRKNWKFQTANEVLPKFHECINGSLWTPVFRRRRLESLVSFIWRKFINGHGQLSKRSNDGNR